MANTKQEIAIESSVPQVEAEAKIKVDLPRQQLQEGVRKSQSITGITIVEDGREVNLLKQILQPEGITVEESLRRFIKQIVAQSSNTQSAVLPEKESKGLIDRIVAAYRSNQKNIAAIECLEKDLRIYLDNLFNQELEKKKNATEEIKAKEEKKHTQADIVALSKQFEIALYNKELLEKLGGPDQEIASLTNKLVLARNALLVEAADRSKDILEIEKRTKIAASQAAQKIQQIYDRVKEGISSGSDLATLLQPLSPSEFQHLANYFRANNSGEHIWQFTEKKLWWSKDEGRQAHGGACSKAAEYQASGLAPEKKVSFSEQILNDHSSSKEQKFELLKDKLVEISSLAAKNIAESAVSSSKDEFYKSVSQGKAGLAKKSDDLYAAIKSLGYDTQALNEAQARLFSSAFSESITQIGHDLASKKALEVKFYRLSGNENIKAQSESREQYWDKRLLDFRTNIRSTNLYNSDLAKSLDAAQSAGESAGEARAKVLAGSLLSFNRATDGLGTKVDLLFSSLSDSDGKLYSPSEINLFTERYIAEFGSSLQEEIRSELSGDDLTRALAMLRADENAVFACELKDASAKAFFFWGPDSQSFINSSSKYQALPEEQKKIVDNELKFQGVLKGGQTFEGYCLTEFSGNTKNVAEAIFSKSEDPTQRMENQAILTAAQVNKHIGFFSDDFREMGKVLEPALIRYDSGDLIGQVDVEKSKLVIKKYEELYGDNLLEKLSSDKNGAKWISALLKADSSASIDVHKYAYASEKNDPKLARTVYDRALPGGATRLQIILNQPDEKVREKELADYQAQMRSHLIKVEAKAGKTLDSFNLEGSTYTEGSGWGNVGKKSDALNVQSSGTASQLSINGKILAEYRNFVFSDPTKLKADDFLALQSVTEMHVAMRNKSWGADDQAVLDQLKDSSNHMLELQKACYKKVSGHDLEKDIDDRLKSGKHLAKFRLEGEPEFKGDYAAYVQAIQKRTERRLELEEKGWEFTKHEIEDLRATSDRMSKDSQFILTNLNDRALSENDRIKFEKAVKRFFSDHEHFKLIADHHNTIQRDRADFWVNSLTTGTVLVVGVGLSFTTFGASLGLLGIAGWTAGSGLAVRGAAKGVLYGSYDLKNDLQEDLFVAARDGALAGVGGVALKGAGAVTNFAVSKLSPRWVALLDRGVQARLAGNVLDNNGVREVVRKGVTVREYAGGGLYNQASNEYIRSGYAYLTKRALEDPNFMYLLEKGVRATGHAFNKDLIEHSLSSLKLSSLRSVVEKIPGDALKNFDATTKSFVSAYINSNPSHLRYILAMSNGISTGAVVGVAGQALSLETYSNQTDEGVVSKLLKAGGIGALAGGILGLGFWGVSRIFDRKIAIGNSVLRWNKNHELSSDEFSNLYSERTWLGMGKLKYDYKVLDQLKLEKGGKIFAGDLKIARDASTELAWYNPFTLMDRIKVIRINKLLSNAETSEELKAGYGIYDSWARKQAASSDNFLKFGAGKEPDTRLDRWLLEAKVLWKVRLWGNYNLTQHQIGVAQEIFKKGSMSRFDLWQFRRTSTLGQESRDPFSAQYGYFLPSSSPLKSIAYSDTVPKAKIWGRGDWVRPVYASERKVDKLDRMIMSSQRVAFPVIGAGVMATSLPSSKSVSALSNLQPRNEMVMVVKSEKVPFGSETGQSIIKKLHKSGQIERSQAEGTLRKITEIKADFALKEADDVTSKFDGVKRSVDTTTASKSSKFNANKPADSIKYQVRVAQDQKDQDFYKQNVNHHDPIIQEQRMLELQIIQQQVIREQVAKSASKRSAEPSAKKLADDPFLLFPFDTEKKEEKKKKEEKAIAENFKDSSKAIAQEVNAQTKRAAEYHSRAMRKIRTSDSSGNDKMLVQRLRDDGQYETLLSSDIDGKPPVSDTPKSKV